MRIRPNPMRIMLSILFISVLISSSLAEKGLRFELGGNRLTVLPLDFSNQLVLALNRNGELLQLKPQELVNAEVVSHFRPYSQAEARGELLREFGKGYEVSGTGNYLVVHPRGMRDLWAHRFEELYRSMTHFFKARGYPMTKAPFPMVGIVFHSEAQYLEYQLRVLRSNASNTYGVYFPTTNRIYLYDATRGQGTDSQEWAENLATIMHESAHQTAFNVGIHQRGGENPRWMVEGLGCLFEARGVYDSLHYSAVADRVNYGRLVAFQQLIDDDSEDIMGALVAADTLFRRDPQRAYAAAWALTFYLSERQPKDYLRLLQLVARHKPFEPYGERERVREFTAVFGKDFRMLGVRVNRFLATLPMPSPSR